LVINALLKLKRVIKVDSTNLKNILTDKEAMKFRVIADITAAEAKNSKPLII